ncbi:hypothetical protein CDIK_1692 [Cucumispora dikerogammari]|nr:hypothetical protein CDIK_1692 [Cucumispora dikerogammari]
MLNKIQYPSHHSTYLTSFIPGNLKHHKEYIMKIFTINSMCIQSVSYAKALYNKCKSESVFTEDIIEFYTISINNIKIFNNKIMDIRNKYLIHPIKYKLSAEKSFSLLNKKIHLKVNSKYFNLLLFIAALRISFKYLGDTSFEFIVNLNSAPYYNINNIDNVYYIKNINNTNLNILETRIFQFICLNEVSVNYYEKGVSLIKKVNRQIYNINNNIQEPNSTTDRLERFFWYLRRFFY